MLTITKLADRPHLRVPGGDVVSLPAGWTDAVGPDPFVVAAGGGVPFRTADLLAAPELVARLRGGWSAAAGSVKGMARASLVRALLIASS